MASRRCEGVGTRAGNPGGCAGGRRERADGSAGPAHREPDPHPPPPSALLRLSAQGKAQLGHS